MVSFYGKYRGFVMDNKDPLKIGRIRVKVPAILGTNETGWALPCLPVTAKREIERYLPPIGSNVWIEFEDGNIDVPI